MEDSTSGSAAAATYAEREARKEARKAAKKQKFLKKQAAPPLQHVSRSQNQQQGQDNASGNKQIIPKQLSQKPKHDQVVQAPQAAPHEEDAVVDPSKKAWEAHPGWSDLRTLKKQQRSFLERHSASSSSWKYTDSDPAEQIRRLTQPHMLAMTPYEVSARSSPPREQRGYIQHPTGLVQKGERASTAPRRFQGEPRLEQKHPFDVHIDPIGQDYHAYKLAHKEYNNAGRAYKTLRLKLTDAEMEPPLNIYKRYAGTQTVRVPRLRPVDGERATVIAEEERAFTLLTPPSHKRLEPYAEDVVDTAARYVSKLP
jgi:hypothetical protein